MSEHGEQVAVIHWARAKGLDYLFAIPNGAKLPYTRRADGSRHSRQAMILLAEGLLPGVSDLFLPVAASGFHGLFIEMKAGKNKTTPEQEAFISHVRSQGYQAVVCYGAGEAINAIRGYLGWTNE